MFRAMLLALAVCILPAGRLMAEERPFHIVGLSHIAIYVHDIEKSREFYKRYLGFDEPFSLDAVPSTAPGAGTQPARLQLTWIKINDRQSIELFPEKQAGMMRTYHMAIETDNAEALRGHLASRGIKVPEQVGKGRIGNWNFTIPDMDGHLLEIVQYAPDGWTMQKAGKFLPADRAATHMDHLIVPVTTFDHALAFYQDVLGCTKIAETKRNDEVVSISLQLPDSKDYLQFVLYKDRPAAEQQGKQTHIGLTAETLPAAMLQQRPLPEGIAPTEFTPQKITARDPDGTHIEITPAGGNSATTAPSK